jgi:hypothetical protein
MLKRLNCLNFQSTCPLKKNQLQEQFKALYEITKLTDKSFVGAVKAGSKTNQRTGQSRKTFIKSTEKKVE